jgi:DNA-binding MarR family transcriptional regulator
MPDDLLRLSNQMCFAVYSTAHALNRVYKPLLEPLGLTYPQYLVMLVLWEGDGVTVKEIGARLRLDSGTLTPLLKRLESAGHLRRTRDSADERQVRIALTDKGRALKERAQDVPRGLLNASGCSANEVTALREELTRLRDQLDTSANKGPGIER